MTEFDALSKLSDEELIREQERLLAELSVPSVGSNKPENVTPADTAIPASHNRNQVLFQWYYSQFANQSSVDQCRSDSKWLESVSHVVNDIDSCFKTVFAAYDSINEEKQRMVADLAGLDEKSKKLLDEQSVLEKEVSELELELNSKSVIRNVDSLSNQKEILIHNFSRFEQIVDSLELVRGDPRQYEHLKSRVCQIALSVGLAAIEVYSKRMLQYIDSLEGGTLSSVSLFGKFTDTLQVVGRIASLFRRKDGREFSLSVVELEKAFSDVRQRICLPVIGDYVNSLIPNQKLSSSLRKGIYFVNSVGKQEQDLFELAVGSEGTQGDSFLTLLRAVGLALYYPLRTGVISTSDLSELRESAEILRLEIFSSSEYLGFIQSVCLKLHRDIQERLIYRIEFLIRDDIRGAVVCDYDVIPPETVKRTYGCLDLITGVVDRQTFHEIANDAVTACVDTLVSSVDKSSSKGQLFLISQLLSLRERVTLIDCEYSLQAAAISEDVGMTDQIKRLVAQNHQMKTKQLVRTRIEAELKVLCENFNAGVIAKFLAFSSNDEKRNFLSVTRDQVRSALRTEGLDLILTRPILVELERMQVDPSVLETLNI